MPVTWFNEQPKDIIITLTSANFTINKPGTIYFDTANQVMLGYNDDHQFFVKPLSKTEVLRGDIPEHARYNITVKDSYSRVTNKAFMSKIADLNQIDLDANVMKYKAIWYEDKHMLVVDMKEALS